MEALKSLTAQALVVHRDNIDTDQIIPARFLKVTDKAGLGDALFADWRYAEDGTPKADFVLNQPWAKGRKILVAGQNFGSGSSREHAPWALLGYGFRAVLARSFADIFRNNALKNGVLPVALGEAEHGKVLAALAANRDEALTVDLEACAVSLGGERIASFEVDAFARHCLLNGLDQLGYLLHFEADIARYEAERSQRAY